jgi:hypothetical protein
LIVFDELSNNNKITWNLKHCQSINKKNMSIFFLFLRFIYIYIKIHYQDYQNNPLSSDFSPFCVLLQKNITNCYQFIIKLSCSGTYFNHTDCCRESILTNIVAFLSSIHILIPQVLLSPKRNMNSYYKCLRKLFRMNKLLLL